MTALIIDLGPMGSRAMIASLPPWAIARAAAGRNWDASSALVSSQWFPSFRNAPYIVQTQFTSLTDFTN
jgi:hypothetical protein